MKSIKLGLGILLIALLGISCKNEAPVTINTPAINTTNKTLVPNPNESGTVRAYIGDEVTAEGFNLDKVGAVRFDGVDAEIVSQTIKKIVFKIPVLDLPQADEPSKVLLEVFDADKETVVFKYDYYVTVPVTDALVSGFTPKSGTVGTAVTISGRNLSQITAVRFGETDATIAECADGAVKVTVPAVPATQATSNLDITAVWSGGDIDVTADEPFVFNIPVFAAYTQTGDARLGDEIALTGENLDLVDGILWGDIALLISEQSATALTVKIPSGIEVMDPALQTKKLYGTYGTPAQEAVIAESFRIDTTPVGPAAPVFTSAAPAEEGYTALYLGREVVVKGQNFASIEKFKVDGVEAALKGDATDIEARFVMPNTITGTAAREVDLIAVWNGGNELDCGKIKVYPFYYTKGLRLRIGSNSKSTYPAANREESFLLLDEGRVVSVQDWWDTPVDPFAKSGSNTVTSTANKVTGSETDYYSVRPYTFAGSNSSNKLTFYNPANTANQLKTHYLDGTTALPTTFGTPVIFFAVVTDATLKGAAAGGTLTDIVTGQPKASAGAPACGASETSSVWVKGSVLTVQYVDYSTASAGNKPGDALAGVRKVGLMHIADITCVDTNGAAVPSREGYIDIDLYWSNVL
ncbi:MAG: IPT/TIG domain-containing protein [Bacteroidales bacterium]|nr:IPT/TIG domain-containing protein [Bacteroidales bacterium]